MVLLVWVDKVDIVNPAMSLDLFISLPTLPAKYHQNVSNTIRPIGIDVTAVATNTTHTNKHETL